MRKLLITMVLGGIAQVALADCRAIEAAAPQARPPAELISSAAAQAPAGTGAAQAKAVMLPASVHGTATQVMGGPPGSAPQPADAPRHHSSLAMVLAALGVMLVIVLRRLGAAD